MARRLLVALLALPLLPALALRQTLRRPLVSGPLLAEFLPLSSELEVGTCHAFVSSDSLLYQGIQVPVTCVVCGGWAAKELEEFDDVLEAVLGTMPPVLVLGPDDLQSARVSDLVNPAVLARRDHEMPSRAPDLQLPIVIFSGLDAPQLRLCLAGLAAKFPTVRRFIFLEHQLTAFPAALPQSGAGAAGARQVRASAVRRDPAGPRNKPQQRNTIMSFALRIRFGFRSTRPCPIYRFPFSLSQDKYVLPLTKVSSLYEQLRICIVTQFSNRGRCAYSTVLNC